MNRILVLTVGSALACMFAAAWIARPQSAWTSVPRVNESQTESERTPSAYPVRVELPPALPAGVAGAPLPAALSRSNDAWIDPPAGRAETLPVPAGEAAEAGRADGLIALDFDIATYGRVAPAGLGTGVRANKPVVVDGERLGSIELSVGEGTVVSFERRALASLVDGRDPRLTAALARLEGERATLDALRTRDIRVRYDPISDAVVIDTSS